MESHHKAHDAWILLAILLAGRPNEHATLDSIIAAADYINHAIPTAGEMDGALSRLLQGGWVEQSELTFAASEQAELMYSDRRDRRTAIHTDLEFVREQIGASSWAVDEPLPQAPERFAVAGLSEQIIQDAYKAYRSKTGV